MGRRQLERHIQKISRKRKWFCWLGREISIQLKMRLIIHFCYSCSSGSKIHSGVRCHERDAGIFDGCFPKMFSETLPSEDDEDTIHFDAAVRCIAQFLKTQIIYRSYGEVVICFFNAVSLRPFDLC